MSSTIPNNTTALVIDQKVIASVDKYFSNVANVTIGGTSFTPATLKAIFQADADAQKAADAGRAKQKELVMAQRAARKIMRALRAQLRTYLLSNYGSGSASMFEDFGFPAPKKATVKVTTKAQALEKSKATRAARGTKGKNQKKAIKGQPSGQPAQGQTTSQK
jgi:hypothetical protein